MTRLQFWRLFRGIRQRDLAERIRIHDTALSHYEAGRRIIPDVHLAALAAELGVPAEALLGEITEDDARRLTHPTEG